MRIKRLLGPIAAIAVVAIIAVVWLATRGDVDDDIAVAKACIDSAKDGVRLIAEDRTGRFQGKVTEENARCRGGDNAVAGRGTPWVDWTNYWAAGDIKSKSERHSFGWHILNRNKRGVDGALADVEYQRMELIKFNLFDNNKTYRRYLTGSTDGKSVDGSILKRGRKCSCRQVIRIFAICKWRLTARSFAKVN
jgi:hypothetical protein